MKRKSIGTLRQDRNIFPAAIATLFSCSTAFSVTFRSFLFRQGGPFSDASPPSFQKGRAALAPAGPSARIFPHLAVAFENVTLARAGSSNSAEKKGIPPAASRPTGRCGVRRDPLLFLLILTSGQALEYSHFVQAGLATHQISPPDLQESRAFGSPFSLADRQLAQGAECVWKETRPSIVHAQVSEY